MEYASISQNIRYFYHRMTRSWLRTALVLYESSEFRCWPNQFFNVPVSDVFSNGNNYYDEDPRSFLVVCTKQVGWWNGCN